MLCRWCFDSIRIELLGALVQRHPGIGFDKAYHRIRHTGSVVNKKKLVPDGPNKVWSMVFMHDSLWNGKPFRVLNVVDDYNR